MYSLNARIYNHLLYNFKQILEENHIRKEKIDRQKAGPKAQG